MIYLDNASTTKPSKMATDAVLEACEKFGNPSSLHGLGLEAEKLVTAAKEATARVLDTEPKNIYFTSGGTESNNTAIFGTAYANGKRGKHIITTKIEHPSVLEPFRILESQGFDVTYLDVNSDGIISLDSFENALRHDTVLVSVMAVNNETGVVLPIEKLKPIMKEKAPNAYLHTDGVQAFCKVNIKPESMGIDLMSMSGHKIHALKGTGALYIGENVRIKPFLNGGGQMKNMRSGTENVPGIAAFGAALAELNYGLDIDKKREKMLRLRSDFMRKIKENIGNLRQNGCDLSSGYILNVSFLGIKAEILLHSLEKKGIFISTGSACSSNKPMPSHVLSAMGLSQKEIMGAVRFSFKDEDFDMDYVVSVLKQEVENIRRYMR